jgi:uncharacterized membrane protein
MQAISKQRLETLTDGIVAIIFTLMALELKRPTEDTVMQLLPYISSYALSALVIGIMWVNHHNMFHLIEKTNTKLIWYNLNLLFWMSLISLPTGSIGADFTSAFAVQFYSLILLGNSLSFTLLNYEANKLMKSIVSKQQQSSFNKTNLFSAGIYLLSFMVSFLYLPLSYILLLIVPAIYFTGKQYKIKKTMSL